MMRPRADTTRTNRSAPGCAGNRQTDGRDRALLAPRHRQRAQRRYRQHRRALRGQGHPRALHELRRGRQHGHEHRSAQRAVCGAARVSWTRAAAASSSTPTLKPPTGTKQSRSGLITRAPKHRSSSDFLVLALPFEAIAEAAAAACLPSRDGERTRAQVDAPSSTGPSAACTSGSIARSPIWSTPSCSIARFTGCTTRASCSRGASQGQLRRTGAVSASRAFAALNARAGD